MTHASCRRQGSRARFRLCLTAILLLGAAEAAAGPCFDRFAERFRVGAWEDPASVDLAGGYPAGVLEPPGVEGAWIAAALQALTPQPPGPSLTAEFLEVLAPGDAAIAWRDEARGRVEALAGRRELAAPPAEGLLAIELSGREVFRRLRAGDPAGARTLALRLAAGQGPAGLADADRLVWEIRAEALAGYAGEAVEVRFWPTLLLQGPYDAANGWALWVARCRALGLSPLAPLGGDESTGRFLGGLRRGWVTSAELEASAFAEPWRAGLGTALLESGELAEHFRRHAEPPADFTVQGWWVQGRRFSRRGETGFYEDLAGRRDLAPGWRLDLWRRASEIHLLAGRWEPGLADLARALALAADGGGTLGLRRQLRHWVEQALALALAQGRPDLAAGIWEQGRAAFAGQELTAYLEETAYWLPRLPGQTVPPPSPGPPDVVAAAAARVEAGAAPALAAADPERRSALERAADQPLWDLWCRWGLALADPEGLSGETLERARTHAAALTRAAAAPAERRRALALGAAGRRLGQRPARERLLAFALDRDVQRLSGWRTVPEPSPVPALVADLQGSRLDLHALLGFALAAGDMRGVLAVAAVLPGSGLTPAEKLRFLYPLPGPGPIRAGLSAATSDPALLLAVARNESLFDPAVRSRAGALGWMQIMPFHYPERGALPGAAGWSAPEVSIARGDQLLAENRRRYGGDPYLAVAAYNAGPGAADRWLEQLGGHPDRDLYLAWIGYAETRRYVEKVLLDREIYDWILAGCPDPAGSPGSP